MKMSMGMNTNVQYQGQVYHVQTEDGGEERPTITCILFKNGGTVAASTRTDYKDLLQSDSCRESVAALMKEQHKSMIRALVRGEIEGLDTSEVERSPAGDPLENEFEKDRAISLTPTKDAPIIQATRIDQMIQSGGEKDLDTLILECLEERDRHVD